MKRGIYIVIEGIDGSGKSTLASNLVNFFESKNLPVVLTKEPGGTFLGKYLRELVQHPEAMLDPKAEFLLFASDRAQLRANVIVPNLQKKKIIISDRSADSSVAYQGYGRGLDVAMIKEVNAWVMDMIFPDITVYVSVDYKTARQRMKKRNEDETSFEQEHEEFFDRVAKGFLTLYQDRKNVIVLDGTLDTFELAKQAQEKITALMELE